MGLDSPEGCVLSDKQVEGDAGEREALEVFDGEVDEDAEEELAVEPQEVRVQVVLPVRVRPRRGRRIQKRVEIVDAERRVAYL